MHKTYVCPPCGQPCDKLVFDKPGTCPKCGMTLVDQATVQTSTSQKKVAILIFDGVQIIDYTGPYEIFGAANFDVYTVGETTSPVTTSMGMTVVPKYSFADAPQPDVLVVPGGGVRGVQNSATTLKWINDVVARTENTMSVCNGAFILASAGLLDGLTATTTAGNIDRMRKDFPKTKVVDNERFVDNGKIITTGGLTAGIDGALHVISKMLGNGVAQQVALGEEYDWHPERPFARAALADRLIPNFDPTLDALGKWEVENTSGTTDLWELVISGTSDSAMARIVECLDQAFSADGTWTRPKTSAASASSETSSDWVSTDENWTCNLRVKNMSGNGHKYSIKVTISSHHT